MDHSHDWPWLTMEINPTTSSQQKDLKHYVILLWCCWNHLLEVRKCARTWRWGNILCPSLWTITFWLDRLVTKGSFHKTKVHTETSGKVSMLTRILRTKVPDLWLVSWDVQCLGAARTQVAITVTVPGSSSWNTQPSIPAMVYPIRREDQQWRGHYAKCSVCQMCQMCPVCSNVEQCVYVSDVNSAEMVEGVSFWKLCVMFQL